MSRQIEPYHDWFLRSVLHTDEVPHSGRTLYAHLVGTYHLLASWDMSKVVCHSGLFHSIYGTNAFTEACLKHDKPEERHLLATVIGERAEQLVFLFCTIERPGCLLVPSHWPTTHFDENERKQLLQIEAANLIEQGGNEQTLNAMLDKCYLKLLNKTRRAVEAQVRLRFSNLKAQKDVVAEAE